MKRLLKCLICAAVLGLLLPGCSKGEEGEEATDELSAEGEGEGGAAGNLPKLSKIQPAKSSSGGADTIVRQADGLWHTSTGGQLFSGTVVYEQDSMRWQEKYEKGVRVFVKAWDEDGQPVELHAWNADGSPRN